MGEDDPSSAEVAAYAEENGPADALGKYSELTEPALSEPIVRYYQLLKSVPLAELISVIERDLTQL